jgi:hypothetical protein
MPVNKLLIIPVFLLVTVFEGYCRTETVTDTIRTKNSIQFESASLVYIGSYSFTYERTVFRTTRYTLAISSGFGEWY